jgi:catechol 2,3-dioxygenase-like lactoylglutathione lyase family enzyme
MESSLLTFHHLGLAVRRPDRAFAFLAALGYREGEGVYDPLQSVNLAMRYHPAMPAVEVIWPGDGPSPVDSIIRQDRALIYHLCFASDDARQALDDLAAAGHQVIEIAPPTEAVLFGGLPVSFHNVLGFGMIEIIHGRP